MEGKNNLELNDLFYMLNAGKELEKNFISSYERSNNNKSNNNIYNENDVKNNLPNSHNDINNLEKEVKDLKDTLISFEEKYGYISPYHDDIINKLKEKKVQQNITLEISYKIYELYENKYYNDCYDLWNIYGFKPLLNLSPEENYEMLRHLTKIKDELYRRKYILQNLDNYNIFNDYNCYFETGISFKQIKDKKNNNNLNNKENFNSNYKNYYNQLNNNNINNESPRTYNENIVKQRINENNLMLEELKKKVLNFSYN